jgi:type 1 fimbriae regulatory protein FimB
MPQRVVPFPRTNGTSDDRRVRETAALRVVSNDRQTPIMGQTPPRRVANAELRAREHLSRDEVMQLVKTARGNRHGTRDAGAIWICFNHGLRVGELCDLRWGDVRWDERKLMIRRLKGSRSGEHILTEQDKRALGPLRARGQRPSDTVFGLTAAGFRKMLARLDLPPELSELGIHPHMLRHSCGYDLVGRADLQVRAAYLGHVRLENTVKYSYLDADQFEGLRD